MENESVGKIKTASVPEHTRRDVKQVGLSGILRQ